MSLPLKPGATPEQALQILDTLANDVGNVFNRSGGAPGGWDSFERKRFDYLTWLANAEGQLGNFADEAHVARQLHTAGLAAIRNADGATPWPAQVLESEIRAQKDALRRAAAALRQQVERLHAARGHIAVLDTHILLHYEPPESIDWPAIVGVSSVRLLLPMKVVDELDEKKYTGSDRVRGKARTALTHLRTLVGADGGPGPVRDGVTIEVELAGEDQRQSDADKSIIETCAELARLTGVANSVSLVTGDAGMLIRAAQREVRAVAMPDEYLRGARLG